MAGYSGTPLLKKLGVKEGMRLFLMQAPKNYFDLLGELPAGVQVLKKLQAETDFIHIFSAKEKALRELLVKAKSSLAKNGTIWVSWPKKAAKLETDLTEDRIRTIILDMGLVDVKVCAVDEIWSGLKIVYRLKDR